MSEIGQAMLDLTWLDGKGALAGAAEMLRERRRQIGLGHTPDRDRELGDGRPLVQKAVEAIVGSPACDKGEVHGLAKAAALCAARIDRIRYLRACQGTSG